MISGLGSTFTVIIKVDFSGRVVDINLRNNYIVIKPSTGRQLVNRALKKYLSEVINPATGQSMINIQIG